MFRTIKKPTKWALALAVCPFTASAISLSGSYYSVAEFGTLTGDSKFGISVAISGNEAIVEMPKADGAMWGDATVYRLSESAWRVEATLSHFQTSHDFGAYLGCNPVAIDGDLAAVGDPSANSNQGVVQVFRHLPTGWISEVTLQDDKGTAADGFGCAVSVSDGAILVGAPGKSGKGAGYVYVNEGSGWKLDGNLNVASAPAHSALGFSGAISGSEAVLGAPHASSDKGAAYVFKKSGSSWIGAGQLSASDGAANDQFGASVAISNGTIVVGAPEHELGDGAAYAFGGTPIVQQQKLSVSTANYYGSAVAIDGDRLAVSRLGNDAVDIFTRHRGVWNKSEEINGFAATRFGGSVSLSGGRALIGAYAESGGRAYLLEDDEIFRDGLDR